MKLKHVVFAFLAALGLWILSWVLIVYIGPFCGWEQRAQFGSMFGAVEALFSGLAFAGIILTILLQKKELELQRKQLSEQNENIKKQQFEGIFFQLLDLYRNVIYETQVNKHEGRDGFKFMWEEFKNIHFGYAKKGIGQPDDRIIEEAYHQFHSQYRDYTAHYFRTLYNIIKFVDRSQIPEKEFYMDLIRSQMSVGERMLLFYNCLSLYGKEKFFPLVVKYSFLKHLPPKEILVASHALFYPKEAYDNI
jgi:hypothetical protein